MSRPSIYKILEIPTFYNFIQWFLAPGLRKLMGKVHQGIFANSKGRVLDVGCGPKLTTPIPEGNIYFVDINHACIRSFQKLMNRNLGCVCSSDKLPFFDSSFTGTRCIGVLHHMSDKMAVKTIREMYSCVSNGGVVIIDEPVWPKNACFRPLAWMLQFLDRGKWVRTEEEWITLTLKAVKGNWEKSRYTSTYLGQEEVVLKIMKLQH